MTIPTREEVERLAAWLERSARREDIASVLRSLSARVEELEAREHAAWKLGYASGLSAAKKGSAP